MRARLGDRSRGTPGTGLGLSLVAAVARLHGFRLTQRQAQQGCCIELECWPHESAGSTGSPGSDAPARGYQ
jgi:K+-sensing histidine kinase KdpD